LPNLDEEARLVGIELPLPVIDDLSVVNPDN
jgi:hypothetical protein